MIFILGGLAVLGLMSAVSYSMLSRERENSLRMQAALYQGQDFSVPTTTEEVAE